MKSKHSRPGRSAAQPAPQLVHFEYEDAAARKVCIAGSFNDWRSEASEMIPMGSGKWVKDLELTPGTYEYRFIIDGNWVTDPRCAHTVPNAFGETNSLLIVPGPERPRGPRKQNSVLAAVLA